MKDNKIQRLEQPEVTNSTAGDEKAKKQKKAKPGFFARAKVAIPRWFREMKSELKKVVWPTRKQLINNVIVAVVVIVCSAIVVWAFDEVASLAVKALINIVA